jgi:hypothetical protein
LGRQNILTQKTILSFKAEITWISWAVVKAEGKKLEEVVLEEGVAEMKEECDGNDHLKR